MKKTYIIWIAFLSIVFLYQQAASQPYFYYDDTSYVEKVWRINLLSGNRELFYLDTANYGGGVTWDPTQTWIFINGSRGDRDSSYSSLNTINANNSTILHLFPDQSVQPEENRIQSFTNEYWGWIRDGRRVCDGIVFNPIRKVFYVSRTMDMKAADTAGKWDNFLNYQETAIYDATTFSCLETLPVPPGWITSVSSVSDDGDNLYLEKWVYQKAKAIGKYSLITKQLVTKRDLVDIIVPGVGKELNDSKKGKYLLAYAYPKLQFSDAKYALYDIDLDAAVVIPFPLPSHGYVSSNGIYVIIEETPVNPNGQTVENFFLHPGRISVFNGLNGSLIQKLTLPSDGKVLVFDNYPSMLYYYLPAEQRSINIDLSKLAPPSGCNVKLVNSTGAKLTGGSLQYYEGAWKDATNNNDGTFIVNTTAKNLSLRMTYQFGSQTKSNVVVGPDTVVFQTVNAQVKIQNSQGIAIDTGSVQYYAGAWRSFGTTSSGIASKELLPANYSFRMSYAFASKDKQQDIGTNPTVVFQTVNASVQLQSSQGVLMDQGTVQYYSGAWRQFGTTINGVANKELLPNNYSFRMTYAYASKDKQQDVGANSTVVFQTVNAAVQLQNSQGALIDQGAVQYYSGAWREFGSTTNGIANKELLPNNYSFRMTYAYASKDKQQDIGANQTVVFQTVNAAVQLKNSLGASIDQGSVQYYSGAWRTFGTTTNGMANKELLPNNYSFRMTYEYVSLDKSQDLSTNSTVDFSTVLCTIRVKNAQSQPVDGATASYYSGAWRQIGNTINGEITKELLPVNLSFRIKYGTQQQDKKQDLATGNVVEFTVQ